MKKVISILLFSSLCNCSFLEKGKEPKSQGAIYTTNEGNVYIYLKNKAISLHPQINENSSIIAYIYEPQADFLQPCLMQNGLHQKNCLRGIAFSNDPGFAIYQNSFGVSNDTIKPLDLQQNQWYMPVLYSNKSQFPEFTAGNYSQFQNVKKPIKDGEQFIVYFAIYFNALNNSKSGASRLNSNSKIWNRPITPDLLSAPININIELNQNKKFIKTFEIPDFNTWINVFGGCQGDVATAGDIVFSEILYSGSQDISGIDFSDDQFIELFNSSSKDINISNWEITISSNNYTHTIRLPLCTTLKSNDLPQTTSKNEKTYVIATRNNASITLYNTLQDLVTLSSSGSMLITLNDVQGNEIDRLDCTSTWPTSNSVTRRSLIQKATIPIHNAPCNNTNWAFSSKAKNINVSFIASSSTASGTLATPAVHSSSDTM